MPDAKRAMPMRRPLDAINPDAIKDRMPPPKTPPAPKRKMTPKEIDEKMKNAGQTGESMMPKRYAKGGSVSSASKRADGCAVKGKTKGKFV